VRALYRPDHGARWIDVLIVSRHPGGLVLREVGRYFPGHWLATLDQVRVEGAGSFSPGTRRVTRRSPRPIERGAGHAAVPASNSASGDTLPRLPLALFLRGDEHG
jgi:hypothetical protein